MASWRLREAESKDCEQIVSLIKEIAGFEKLESHFKMTAEQLREDGFGKDPAFRCIVAETESESACKLVGYAVYFFTYATFEGRSIYLEDLYVSVEHRSKGIGTAMWRKVAQVGIEMKCKRLDFLALDWNKKAIDLYESYGATNISTRDGWQLFRMEGKCLRDFAGAAKQ